MNILKSGSLGAGLVLITGVFLIASCKPAEETKPAPPPATATNPPPVGVPVTPEEVNGAPTPTNTAAPITPAQAREHIGDQATVRGEVSDVHVTQKGDVFLNFGGKHPNAVFTAVCFKSALPSEELTALKGQTISVSGKIKEYNGQVEIILNSADQISK
jgi:hypothetical protein